MKPDPLVVEPLTGALDQRLRLSLVVPTYNESRNIRNLVEQLTAHLNADVGDGYEIIIVDDDSPDQTWRIAQAIADKDPRIKVIHRRGERGLSSAVVRGWQSARGTILAVIDADLQHPPKVICELFRKVEGEHDLAVGSRHVEGGGVSNWSLIRRIISRGAQFIGLLILPGVVGKLSDPMSGYFALKRSAIQGVELNPLGYKILLEVIGRGRVSGIAEVPYVFRERTEGASKVTRKVYIDYLRHLLRLRWATLPVKRFVMFCTVGFSGVLVDMSVLYLLSDPSTLAWGLTRSKLIGAELAIVNNFFWNDLWTFRDKSAGQSRAAERWRRFLKFQIICLIGLTLNTGLLNFQFNVLDMNRYVANAVAICAVTAWNFWLNLKLNWRTTAGAPNQ